MDSFIAKRDLSPENFEIFSKQYRNDFRRCRSRINYYRDQAAIAEQGAKSWLLSLNQTKAAALKHGVELEP